MESPQPNQQVKIEIVYDGQNLSMNRPIDDPFFQWVILKLAEMIVVKAQPKAMPMPPRGKGVLTIQ